MPTVRWYLLSCYLTPEEVIRWGAEAFPADALNRHTLHTASALFACPPGATKGGFVGEGLFA